MVSYGNAWSTRQTVCQFVFVTKSPNLMSTECTTPMVYILPYSTMVEPVYYGHRGTDKSVQIIKVS